MNSQLIEALLHPKFFLEMIVRHGKESEAAQNLLSSGCTAVLCVYDLR
jgi:hypothetical protein